MRGNKFLPEELTVPAGATIVWVNEDPEDHDVLTRDLRVVSPVMKTGEIFTLVLSEPGSFAYLCDLHANMEGVVTVTAARR